MLILSRKKKEVLRIGEDILLTVIDIQGDQVRLGITAPREVQVLRQELYDAVKDSNAQAAQTVQNKEGLVFLKKMTRFDRKDEMN
jgi:carbon storage regulator